MSWNQIKKKVKIGKQQVYGLNFTHVQFSILQISDLFMCADYLCYFCTMRHFLY